MSRTKNPSAPVRPHAVHAPLPLTLHAVHRISQRGISWAAIEACLDHGRCQDSGDCQLFVVGWREVERCARHGIDIAAHQGMHAVVANDGALVTVYRNRGLDGLRRARRRARHPHRRH